MSDRIPIADPGAEYRELAAEIDEAVRRVLASGRYILGPEGAALEGELAAFVGAAHAVGVNSGTDALHFPLRAAGIGAGDEVVMPSSPSSPPRRPCPTPAHGPCLPTSTRRASASSRARWRRPSRRARAR